MGYLRVRTHRTVRRIPRLFTILGFASTHDALDAEALLLDLGIDAVPIPAPKALGTLCGIALRLEPADEKRALGYLADADISVAARGEVEDV
jgi:hypothetical protein